jgi:hypothetical protein
MITKLIAATVVFVLAAISPVNETNKMFDNLSITKLSDSKLNYSFHKPESFEALPGIRILAALPGIRILTGISDVEFESTLSNNNQTMINETSKGVRV